MNDRYQLPSSPERQPIVHPNPEARAELTWTQEVKQIEQSIEALRATADATTIPRYGVRRYFAAMAQRLIASLSNESLARRLVDIESEIGGQLLPAVEGVKSQRFWFYEGDWFYETIDQKGAMHARYQAVGNELEKLVNGKPVSLAEGEQDHFIQLVPLYYQAIKDELYERAKQSPEAAQVLVAAEMQTIDQQIEAVFAAPDVNDDVRQSDLDRAA